MMKTLPYFVGINTILGLMVISLSACSSDINSKPAGDCWNMLTDSAICYSHGYKSDGFNNTSNAGMHFDIKPAKQSDGHFAFIINLVPVNPDNQYCKKENESTCQATITINKKDYTGNLIPEFVGNGKVLTSYSINNLSQNKEFLADIRKATTFNITLKDKDSKPHSFKFTAKQPLETHSNSYFDWKNLQ